MTLNARIFELINLCRFLVKEIERKEDATPIELEMAQNIRNNIAILEETCVDED